MQPAVSFIILSASLLLEGLSGAILSIECWTLFGRMPFKPTVSAGSRISFRLEAHFAALTAAKTRAFITFEDLDLRPDLENLLVSDWRCFIQISGGHLNIRVVL